MPLVDLTCLRICLIAGTLGQGGAERQLFYMAKTLRQSGADVRVLSLTRGEFWESRLRDLGVVVTWVGRSASRVARVIEIIRQVRRHPADIVQSQHFYTNLYAVAAARALGLPEIGAVRNDALSEVREHRMLGGLSLRMPRVLAANSRAGVVNAIALGAAPGRVRLLPNVVDCEAFHPAPRDYTRESVTLLAAGRFTEQKRFDRFISILAAVRSVCGSHVKGLIVGQGKGDDSDAHRKWLTYTAEALGLPPTALEFRSRTPDMLAVYQECDVFVLSSDWEGTQTWCSKRWRRAYQSSPHASEASPSSCSTGCQDFTPRLAMRMAWFVRFAGSFGSRCSGRRLQRRRGNM